MLTGETYKNSFACEHIYKLTEFQKICNIAVYSCMIGNTMLL